MKRRFTVLLFLSFSIFGCKKDDINTNLAGTWELRTVQGGIGTINYTPGNGNIIKFSGNEYQFLDNGARVKSGSFTIVADPDYEKAVCLVKKKGEFENRVVFTGDNTSQKVFVEVSSKKLILVSGCFAVDAGSRREYIKQ